MFDRFNGLRKESALCLNYRDWENEPDKYGNTISIQLNSVKDKREEEGKVYIGNAKPLTSKNYSDNENAEDGDGLPF